MLSAVPRVPTSLRRAVGVRMGGTGAMPPCSLRLGTIPRIGRGAARVFGVHCATHEPHGQVADARLARARFGAVSFACHTRYTLRAAVCACVGGGAVARGYRAACAQLPRRDSTARDPHRPAWMHIHTSDRTGAEFYKVRPHLTSHIDIQRTSIRVWTLELCACSNKKHRTSLSGFRNPARAWQDRRRSHRRTSGHGIRI